MEYGPRHPEEAPAPNAVNLAISLRRRQAAERLASYADDLADHFNVPRNKSRTQPEGSRAYQGWTQMVNAFVGAGLEKGQQTVLATPFDAKEKIRQYKEIYSGELFTQAVGLFAGAITEQRAGDGHLRTMPLTELQDRHNAGIVNAVLQEASVACMRVVSHGSSASVAELRAMVQREPMPGDKVEVGLATEAFNACVADIFPDEPYRVPYGDRG